MKTCKTCGETKPLEEFCSDKRRPDGHIRTCRDCHNAAMRAKRASNPGETRRYNREAMRRWRTANPQRAKRQRVKDAELLRQRHPDYFREWYARNSEKERARSREVMRRWREENPKAERETKRRYRINNLAAVQERERANTHRRRALMAESPSGLREHMTRMLRQPCAYCGATENITVDHVVPLSRGGKHEAENLAPACYPCNSSKSDRLLSEWPGRSGSASDKASGPGISEDQAGR